MNFPYRLIFIRHGETDWNVAGRLQGQRDVPLNGRGRDQSANAGRTLRDFYGADFASVIADVDFYASPMLRTRETMDIARLAMGLPPQPYELDDRLKEISFGQWEGSTWDELKKRDPAAVKQRNLDRWGFTPPDGESYGELNDRLAPFLASLTGDSVIISHGGVARVLLARLGGMATADAPQAEIAQGRLIVFESGEYRWV